MERTLKILVVDDEEIFCNLLASSLKHRGYNARCVLNGKEALESVAQETFDVVITDLYMPEIDGFEVMRRVRSIAPQTVLIMITGSYSPQKESEAMSKGANAFFRKPFAVNDLLCHLPPLDKQA